MITEDRKMRALVYLAETDEECAELEGETLRRERLLEMIKSKIFLGKTGSVAERNAMAEVDPETSRAHEEWVQALVRFKSMKAKRASEALIIEVWRSENANRRQAA